MSFDRLRFSDSEINQANNIDILSYATAQGLEIKRINDRSYKVEGYGGLYINPIENRWNCFQKEAGGGPIQFVMFLHKNTWVEAIKELLGKRHQLVFESPKRYSDYQTTNKEFVLPEKNDTFKHMVAYLTQTRKIDNSIINKLIKEKKLYEDVHRNCVFVGTDLEGNPKYANLRSTNTNINSFKGDAKNSDKAFPFSIKGEDEEVYVFESPIEVLSYMTIKKQFDKTLFEHHAISLSGVGDKALENYLLMYPSIKKIVLCLNNDQAGYDGAERIKSRHKEYKIYENYPIHKDYNEDLKKLVRAKEIKERFPNIDWEKELQNKTIIEINQDDAQKIIDSKEPLGHFYYREGRLMVGIDNSKGQCLKDNFYNFENLVLWQFKENKTNVIELEDVDLEL